MQQMAQNFSLDDEKIQTNLLMPTIRSSTRTLLHEDKLKQHWIIDNLRALPRVTTKRNFLASSRISSLFRVQLNPSSISPCILKGVNLSAKVFLAIFLSHRSSVKPIKVKFSFAILDLEGQQRNNHSNMLELI